MSTPTEIERAMADELANLRIKQRERAEDDLRNALEAALIETDLLPERTVERHLALALMRAMFGDEAVSS